MAFIPARGFLGTIKDIVLRGFNIGAANTAVYSMGINGITARDLLSGSGRCDTSLNAQGRMSELLSARAEVN